MVVECVRCGSKGINRGLAILTIEFPIIACRESMSFYFCVDCCEAITTFMTKDNFTPDDIIKLVSKKNYEDEKPDNSKSPYLG